MKIKEIIKIIYTYLFNWHNIIRFSKFGKKSFLGRRCIVNIYGKGIFIEDNVRIGNDARFSCYESKEYLNSTYISIEAGAYIGNRISILTASYVVIEKDVLMASDIRILGENHGMNPEISEKYGSQPLTTSPIRIKEGSWIGENVTILCGKDEKKERIIGKKSIIGANSLVNIDIPDYCIAVGNPVRIIKKYNFEKHRWDKI